MLSKSTELFAKSIGLKIAENSAFGIYGDYFISVYEAKTKKTLKIACYIGNNEEYADDYLNINDGLRAIIGKYSITDYNVKENGVTVVTSAPIASLREMTDCIVALLDENEIPNSHNCSDCGAEFIASEKRRIVTVVKGNTEEKRLLCEKCALTAAEEAETSPVSENPDNKPNYIKGMLLSVLAGIGASAVYVLLFFLLGVNGRADIIRFFACLAGFLIGGMVFFVYKTASGGVDSKGMIAVCGITTVLLLVSHFFGCVLGLAKHLNGEFSISYTTFSNKFANYMSMQFSDSASLRFLIIGLIIGLCAAFIAIVILYSSAFKKEDAKRRVKVTIQTVK